jgi:hypothetical protein
LLAIAAFYCSPGFNYIRTSKDPKGDNGWLLSME